MTARRVAILAGALLLAAIAWFVSRPARLDTAATAASLPNDVAVDAPATETAASRSADAESESLVHANGGPGAPTAFTSVQLVDDPEGDAKIKAHFEALLPRIYEDVPVELGLDAAGMEALLSLLVEQRLREFAQEFPDTPERMEAYQALEAQFETELIEQLGAVRARALANYRRTENARYEVDDLRRHLEEVSLPLSEVQRKTLIRNAIERGAYLPPSKLTSDALSIASQQATYARFEQRDQRLLAIARGVLNPEQAAAVESLYADRQRAYVRLIDDASRNEARQPGPR